MPFNQNILFEHVMNGKMIITGRCWRCRHERYEAYAKDVVFQLGSVEYVHGKEEEGGNFTFKFNLRDSEGKKLTEQCFLISVLGMYQFSSLSF